MLSFGDRSIIDDAARKQLVDSIVATGAPPAQAAIAVDLAAQACDQAVAKFFDVAHLAGSPACGMTAVEIGAQLLQHRMGMLLRDLARLGEREGLFNGKSQIVEVAV